MISKNPPTMNGMIEQIRLLAPVLAGALTRALMNWTQVINVARAKSTMATMQELAKARTGTPSMYRCLSLSCYWWTLVGKKAVVKEKLLVLALNISYTLRGAGRHSSGLVGHSR